MTAGLFSSLRFHGDHQPPKFIASQLNQAWWRRLLQQPVLFRFYPQCETCSRQQGPLVKSGWVGACDCCCLHMICAVPGACLCTTPARDQHGVHRFSFVVALDNALSLLSGHQRKAPADAHHEAAPPPLAPRLYCRGTVPSCVAGRALDKAPAVTEPTSSCLTLHACRAHRLVPM